MHDEYGEMDAADRVFTVASFALESGLVLPEAKVAFRTWGLLAPTRNNVVFVAHALTGNAAVDGWWGALLGDSKPFDTSRHFVVCANMLGSCYGSSSPLSAVPSGAAWVAPREGTRTAAAGARYAADFPHCTVRDTVALHRALLDHLDVRSVLAVVGGSAGGMQALEWAIMFPGFVQKAVVMACGATQSAWQIAISEAQRQAIYRDPHWNSGFYSLDAPPADGLSVARQQAMVWYRSQEAYDRKFGRALQEAGSVAAAALASSGGGGAGAPNSYAVEGYLEHQGTKFVERFDANCYVALTRLIDSHDVSRGRGTVQEVLGSIHQPVLVVGISSDALYPLDMQKELAAYIPRATLRVVHSAQGHDGFLLETARVGGLISAFLGSDKEAASAQGTFARREPPLTTRLPRSTDAMNAALAAAPSAGTAGPDPPESTGNSWFFGI